MSTEAETRAEWLDSKFWDRLDRLEGQHRRLQCEHESARRNMHESVRRHTNDTDPAAAREIREAWRRYCSVIAQLDRATSELESLRQSAP